MQHLMLLLIVMLIVFSGFSLVTNVQSSNMYKNSLNGTQVNNIAQTYSGILTVSLGSKASYFSGFTSTAFNIQCWLGFVFIILWAFLFLYIEIR